MKVRLTIKDLLSLASKGVLKGKDLTIEVLDCPGSCVRKKLVKVMKEVLEK